MPKESKSPIYSSESAFWRTLRSSLQTTFGPLAHYERLENNLGRGMPDFMLCIGGKYAFIELKIADEWRHLNLEHHQKNWHLIHQKAQGNCWVVYKFPPDKGQKVSRKIGAFKIHKDIPGKDTKRFHKYQIDTAFHDVEEAFFIEAPYAGQWADFWARIVNGGEE